ncbi:MAG: ABC transporter substrate-binding protein [Hyphomicrobiaceae bacterium]
MHTITEVRMPKFTRIGLAGVVALSIGAQAAWAGKRDDNFVWTTDRETAVVDPYYNNTRELTVIGELVWDGLLSRDTSGKIVPGLATSWKWVDNKTIEAELRDDAKFHDGTPVDADDVVYTLNFAADKKNGVLTYSTVSWIDNVEKLAANKVRINLKKPFPAALDYLANSCKIVPKGHYDKAPVKADGKKDYSAVKPVGSGPYKVAEVKPGAFIKMVKNDAYFKGKPHFGKIRFRTIKDKQTQIAELLTGGVNWIWDVPKDQAERLKDTGQVEVKNAKTLRVSYLQFDAKGRSGNKIFTDKRLRQAVGYAVNREAIAKNLVGEASEVVNAPCHPEQFGCTPDVTKDVPRFTYDPAKARALLKEAGHPDGFSVDLYAYRERQFTEAVIGDLAKVGIRARLNFMQFRALRDKVRKGEVVFDHMTWGSGSIPDASAMVNVYFTGGPDDLTQDKEVIELADEAGSSVDPEMRKTLYNKLFKRIANEAYWIPMFTYAKYYAWSKDVNFTPTSDEIPRFALASWK